MRTWILAGLLLAAVPARATLEVACKKECPTAKTEIEYYTCTETMEHDPDIRNAPGFAESPCHQAHLKYEADLIAKAQAEQKALAGQKLPTFELRLTRKGYRPEVTRVPAGKPFKLVIRNELGKDEEFESPELEIIDYPVPKGGPTELVINKKLEAGEYKFCGEWATGAKLVATPETKR